MTLIKGLVDGSIVGEVRPLLIDTSGRIIVSEIAKELPTGSQHIGTIGNEGFINGAWKKDPIRLGYSDNKVNHYSNTNLAAGTNTLDMATIPAGEIWVITNIALAYTGTITNVTASILIRQALNDYYIFMIRSLVSGIYQDRQLYTVFKPSDIIRAIVTNATAGDDFTADITGIRIDIDQ